MGEVEAFEIEGLRCYFASADHYPHHFEVVRRGAYVVRIYFLRTTRKRGLNWEYKMQLGGTFSRADQEDVYAMVMRHKRRLLTEFNRKVCPERRR